MDKSKVVGPQSIETLSDCTQEKGLDDRLEEKKNTWKAMQNTN